MMIPHAFDSARRDDKKYRFGKRMQKAEALARRVNLFMGSLDHDFSKGQKNKILDQFKKTLDV